MATESTQDALIDLNGVPANQEANISVLTTPNGTILTNAGTTTDLKAFVKGNLKVAGGTVTNATFTFSTDPSSTPTLSFTGINCVGSQIQGTSANETVQFGVGPSAAKSTNKTVATNTTSSLGSGADSVSFVKKSVVRDSSFNMGQGADTVTFAKGSKNLNTTVDLGARDGNADVVGVEKNASSKMLKITNFGSNDTLTVGNKTYTYEQIEGLNGKVNKNIQVDFG